MSIESSVCDLIKLHWNELHPDCPVPESFVFLKVEGKTSPNAAIVGMILDAQRRVPVAVAKIPRNPEFVLGITHEYDALVDLRASVSDTRILDHTPIRGTIVELDGKEILLQAAGSGTPMIREMTSRKSIEAMYVRILPWMFDFHANGAEERILEGEILREFVEVPIENFMLHFGDISPDTLSDQVRQYLNELPRRVDGRKVRLCRQHGDFNAYNILVEYDGGRLNNFFLIDWEDYSSRELPVHDLNHFFTSNSHSLGAGMSPVESYVKFVLSSCWYSNIYTKAINDYETQGVIGRETFLTLSPLYFISMCFKIAAIQREQQKTAPIWIKRMDRFISKYSRMLE